jgi:hypothetical protein
MWKDHAEIIWSKLNHGLLESVALKGMAGESLRERGLEIISENNMLEREKLKKEWKEFEDRWQLTH